ncbi:MAG: CAP domain-containing protein [Microgenomates group bacterium]
MKRIVTVLLVLVIGAIAYFFLRDTDFKSLFSDLASQRFYIQREQGTTFIPDWTAEELLLEINTAREKKGLTKLKGSTKLDQSAKSRLSVILSEDDVDGSVTGLTREKALLNAGYSANLVGELIVTDFFKSNDVIAYWNNSKITNDTLNHPSFRDVGVAIKNSADKVDVYILLASPRAVVKQQTTPKITWGGPELWAAVNKRRVEMGVNPLKQRDELCTIASIRLNQLLTLGRLDGHEGFVPVLNREDLKWISEKYNISEYLIQGYSTPTEAVAAWENTLGHKSLLAGGEYVWGCVYAQNTIGVAIAAY